MDEEATLCEEECITFDLPWRFNDFLHLLRSELWQIVDELPLVCAVRDHEPEAEAEVLDYSPAEVVSLNHLQILYRLRANAEHHGETNCLKVEEVGTEVVLDQTLRWVIFFT